jgi:uncharacterized protein
MTPDERQMITDLFERMRNYGAPEKDRQAEALINQQVRANPDAVYMLVQSVLVQEQAVQAANDRVLELEEQLRNMDQGAQRSGRSGGFLGGFWGNSDRREEAPRASGSVPQVGSRATPPAYGDRPSSPWSQGGAQPAPQQAPAGGGGGSFMRSALGTAAGVAGGVLLADSIRNMMGGGAHAGSSSSSSEAAQRAQDARDDAAEDARDDDQAYQDARDDSDSDSGFDSGGDDIEV